MASELGGILWVPDGGHFLQESDDIEWIINKALKYFGDIPYEDIEYEWILSPNTNKVNIVKIILHKPPINVLSFNMVNGLNAILEKLNHSQFCDGYMITAHIPESRKDKLAVFGSGYDLKLMAKMNRELTKQYFFALKKLEYLMNASKKPMIAAINGAVIAGSVLLALRCDYRIMFSDSYIAMNEVRNGIKFRGQEIHHFIQRFVGSASKATYVLQTGKNFYAKEAKQMGLIDAIIEKRDTRMLLDESIRVLEEDYFVAEKEAAALARQLGRDDLMKNYDQMTDADAELYADSFFDPKVQAAIQKLFKKTKKSKL